MADANNFEKVRMTTSARGSKIRKKGVLLPRVSSVNRVEEELKTQVPNLAGASAHLIFVQVYCPDSVRGGLQSGSGPEFVNPAGEGSI